MTTPALTVADFGGKFLASDREGQSDNKGHLSSTSFLTACVREARQ